MKNAPSASLTATEAAPSDAAQKHTFMRQWIVMVVSLLIIGGVLGNNLQNERRDIETAAKERLSQGAKFIAFSVERRLASIDSALLDLRKKLPYLSAQQNSETLVEKALETFQNTVESTRTVAIFDAQGTVTASSHREAIGRNFRGTVSSRSIR